MFHISVTNPDQQDTLQHEGGPIELGRSPAGGGATLTINDQYISRRQVCLEPTADGRVVVNNLGANVVLNEEFTLNRGDSRTVDLPARIVRGHTRITISADGIDDTIPEASLGGGLQTISDPIRSRPFTGARPGSLDAIGQSPRPEQLARWFETLISVQKSAGGSPEFFDETARAVVELVGMDRGMVVLRQDDWWEVVAAYAPGSVNPEEFSRTVLNRVYEQKRTYFETTPDASEAMSLAVVDAYVASPIFSAQDEVVGVVFGSRNQSNTMARGGITALEAQVVQLLASSVSAGMARVEQEAEAARVHVQLEQFASPELVRELEREPNLLEPTDREVSVLFGDLRGFSRICEALTPQDTYRLVGDVMERLSQCIADHGGFVIDYSGDGIGAMWNAPTPRPDHARRACLAGLAMQAEMPALTAQWQDKVGEPLRLGVGVNTGLTQVGNAGSKRRLKYSPLGHTVNLASRVEGATKQFGIPSLITEATRGQLEPAADVRRLWRVRVMGIQQPVTIYELARSGVDDRWRDFRRDYETALDYFERGQHDQVTPILDRWVKQDIAAKDVATLRMLNLVQQPAQDHPFDPVWNLDRK